MPRPAATPLKAFCGSTGSIETPSLPPIANIADREDEDDRELREERDAEDLGRQLDVEVAHQHHAGDAAEREVDPGDVDGREDVEEALRERDLQERREPADERGREERVGRRQRHAGHQPELGAEAVADVREHAARRAQLARHLDVADREDRQDDGGEEEARRRAQLVAGADREREVEHEDGERGRPRHAQEQDADQAELAAFQQMDVVARTDVHRGDRALVAHVWNTGAACHAALPWLRAHASS